jgi:molecular chaperone HscC
VPVSRVKEVSTIRDGQREITVPIYQGESRMVSDNVYLGKIEFPIPPKRAGEVVIDVRFTYDISGVLEAEVTVRDTGAKHKVVLAENAGVMSQEEIEKRFVELSDLKIHPRDRMENRTLIARADRQYEQSLGDMREFLAHQIAQFQAALDSQDPDAVRRAAAAFKQTLDDIDSESFL